MTTQNPANSNPVERYAHEEFPIDSITSLANAAGVTYGTVHKTIQGLYSAIPKSLVTYIAKHSDYPADYWQDLYNKWQHQELTILRDDIKGGKIEATALYVSPSSIGSTYGSFKSWRESLSYSQMDFCKTFLVHQTILNNYENGKMKSLPVSIKERLKFLGMSDDYIKAVGELAA
jgi:hypothetical protein